LRFRIAGTSAVHPRWAACPNFALQPGRFRAHRLQSRAEVAMKRRRQPPLRSAHDFFSKPKAFQERWKRGLRAVSLMKNKKLSLREASIESEVDPRFVRRWMSPALRRNASGRYTAKPSNRLLRILRLPSAEGPSVIEVATRDSREAALIGRYWRLVAKFLRTGDETVFARLRRKTVLDANGKRIRLLFDPDVLHLLGDAGRLDFEGIYAQTA
jgi:hypothetical protein